MLAKAGNHSKPRRYQNFATVSVYFSGRPMERFPYFPNKFIQLSHNAVGKMGVLHSMLAVFAGLKIPYRSVHIITGYYWCRLKLVFGSYNAIVLQVLQS